MTQPIEFYRSRRKGPELELEDAIVRQIPGHFEKSAYRSWAGASVPIGAGMPDIVLAHYEPALESFRGYTQATSRILSYLRLSGPSELVQLGTISGLSKRNFEQHIEELIDGDIVSSRSSQIRIKRLWQRIIPEITAIEVKVANWKVAVAQASRNRVFAHRSLVALPSAIANRICKERTLIERGLGVISISPDGAVETLLHPRKRNPMVWSYYYHIGYLISDQLRRRSSCHTK